MSTQQKIETLRQAMNDVKDIPDELWCVGVLRSEQRRCFIGHILSIQGVRFSPTCDRTNSIERIMREEFEVLITSVNDGRDPLYPQPTPRLRVLAALTDCINHLQSELQHTDPPRIEVSSGDLVRYSVDEVVDSVSSLQSVGV